MPEKLAKKQIIRRAQRTRRKQHHALVQHKLEMIADSLPIEALDESDPGEALQLVINRTTFLWRAACAEVDRLKKGMAKNQADHDHELWPAWDESGNLKVEHNYWVEQEERLREQLRKLTESSLKLGLSERRVSVQEGQLQLLGEALQTAAQLSGLTPEQTRLLGANLRTELATLEGTARPSAHKANKAKEIAA